MTPAQRRVVAEDLAFLRSWGDSMSQAEVRRGAATLRRLLIENAFAIAWRAAGFAKQPYVECFDLDKFLAHATEEKVVFALTGGSDRTGLQRAGFLLTEFNPAVSDQAFANQMMAGGEPKKVRSSLTAFLKAPCAYAFGTKISRADVIKYISYVKGGVHISASLRKNEEELARRVQAADNKFLELHTGGLWGEMVAIAQDVGYSDDAKQFVNQHMG